MKLNIEPHVPTPIVKPQPKPKTGYESPIGWWRVTTEGDCEGRTIKDLGVHYGHVAEIAFALASSVYYGLRFSPEKPLMAQKGKRSKVKATGDTVWISLNIDSGTWDLKGDERATFMKKWLDANESIEVLSKEPNGAVYYASVYLRLRK